MEVFISMKNERIGSAVDDRKIYPFTNDYMFCYVLSSNPDLAKELLELILDIQIDHVEVIEAQKVLNYNNDSHSIRLDVYLKNDTDIFDVEMQAFHSRDLERRMRYYQSANACEDLNRGDDYNKLKNCYVIFICDFDPFHKGDAIYRFSMKNEKYDDLNYDDGAYNIVVNIRSKDPNISDELRNLLHYLNEGKAVDNFTLKLQNEVEQINRNPNWRKKAMTIEEKINLVSRISREEGKEEGRIEGISQSRELFIQYLIDHGKTEDEACLEADRLFSEGKDLS